MASIQPHPAQPQSDLPQPQGDPDFNPVCESAPVAATCPKCHTKLIDPSGMGWCRACGYCKSLEEDKARVPLETSPRPQKASPLGVVEFGHVVAKLPSWVWVLLGGAGFVVAINIMPARAMAADSFPRAVWSTAEIVIGMLMIFTAQLWALCILAPEDEKLHFKDAILSGRLWFLTLGRLPATRGQTWLAGWGLACILSAVFVTGGLTHWQNYLPKKAVAPPVVEKVE